MFNIEETKMNKNGSVLSVVDDKIFGGMENDGNPDIIYSSSVKENVELARKHNFWLSKNNPTNLEVGMYGVLIPSKGEGRKVGDYFLQFEVVRIEDFGFQKYDDNFNMRQSPHRSAILEIDTSYRYKIHFGESIWARLTLEQLGYINQFPHSSAGFVYTRSEHKYSKAA